MADLILEPYSINQRWSASERMVPWERLIAEYLESIARRCSETGSCVMGHIKGIALFPGGDYLRISVVSPDRGADVEGHAPANTTAFVLSLNVVVYGRDRDSLERISREEAKRIRDKQKGGVRIDEV